MECGASLWQQRPAWRCNRVRRLVFCKVKLLLCLHLGSQVSLPSFCRRGEFHLFFEEILWPSLSVFNYLLVFFSIVLFSVKLVQFSKSIKSHGPFSLIFPNKLEMADIILIYFPFNYYCPNTWVINVLTTELPPCARGCWWGSQCWPSHA